MKLSLLMYLFLAISLVGCGEDCEDECPGGGAGPGVSPVSNTGYFSNFQMIVSGYGDHKLEVITTDGKALADDAACKAATIDSSQSGEALSHDGSLNRMETKKLVHIVDAPSAKADDKDGNRYVYVKVSEIAGTTDGVAAGTEAAKLKVKCLPAGTFARGKRSAMAMAKDGTSHKLTLDNVKKDDKFTIRAYPHGTDQADPPDSAAGPCDFPEKTATTKEPGAATIGADAAGATEVTAAAYPDHAAIEHDHVYIQVEDAITGGIYCATKEF